MEKFILISLAVSLSVIFYVVAYFLISWQWPETMLSITVCAIVLFLLIGERDHSYRVKPIDLISTIAPDHHAYFLSGYHMVKAGALATPPPSSL
jgi:hypothetical protein